MNETKIESGHPVFEVCRKGDAQELRRFLAEGISVYSESESDPPLVAIACGHGHVECVDALLDFGLDINQPFNRFQQPPIQQAISYGHSDLVEYLIDKGANVNQADEFGSVPLRSAVGSGKIGIARILIDSGAETRTSKPNLILAATQGNQVDSLEFLDVELGIEPDELNIVDPKMGSPLIAASKKGNYEAAKWLLDHGADKNVRDRFRKTALDWAEANGHQKLVDLLTRNGVGSGVR